MTPEELAKREEEEFHTGPLSILTQSVKNNTQVWVVKKIYVSIFKVFSPIVYFRNLFLCVAGSYQLQKQQKTTRQGKGI